VALSLIKTKLIIYILYYIILRYIILHYRQFFITTEDNRMGFAL